MQGSVSSADARAAVALRREARIPKLQYREGKRNRVRRGDGEQGARSEADAHCER